ncbi:MAG TPA: hypothetical protein VM756_06125, partial [Burkholderiales bacterium]|nr:hypothetical protein [Burkholderiales bacterium]
FLAFFDKTIPLGAPLEKLSAVVVPIYAQLGVKTGKERSETFRRPIGEVLVSALCSLARRAQTLRQVRQFNDGCLLEATLPSDLWSWEGTLYARVSKATDGTRVDGATSIKGQLFDWGKSNRCLGALFEDLNAIPAG